METERTAPELVEDAAVGRFARAALLAALMGASVVVTIPLPFSPVPITLQVLFVFLAGLLLGPVWGTVSILLYLTAGAIGIPIFSGMSGGLGPLFGPTGGYLWGYALGAGVIGLFVHRGTDLRDPADASLPLVVGALLIGLIVIYGLGTGYMAWLQQLTATEALLAGAVPFLPGDLLKLVAAIAIVKSRRIVSV
ncbi:biotin transporter BioY [Natrarchaeobaculum aegyptiacum]|uniref:Biotin transporter BioY n=1 Tax=Natrarchaeobaculum aegyptiacum TaxID=745377 RepID=A0A2Z2HWK0_9EURY|nr:biotin transporter BioY [Natrarchaeobaculum aegyptiacum]ARS91630.1 biotin transporter BioY [Natrarchaeobaculum aegyptiacum]